MGSRNTALTDQIPCVARSQWQWHHMHTAYYDCMWEKLFLALNLPCRLDKVIGSCTMSIFKALICRRTPIHCLVYAFYKASVRALSSTLKTNLGFGNNLYFVSQYTTKMFQLWNMITLLMHLWIGHTTKKAIWICGRTLKSCNVLFKNLLRPTAWGVHTL